MDNCDPSLLRVSGFIFAWGRIEIHPEGFRAEFAKPAAFFVPRKSLVPYFELRRELVPIKQIARHFKADVIDLGQEGAIGE